MSTGNSEEAKMGLAHCKYQRKNQGELGSNKALEQSGSELRSSALHSSKNIICRCCYYITVGEGSSIKETEPEERRIT